MFFGLIAKRTKHFLSLKSSSEDDTDQDSENQDDFLNDSQHFKQMRHKRQRAVKNYANMVSVSNNERSHLISPNPEDSDKVDNIEASSSMPGTSSLKHTLLDDSGTRKDENELQRTTSITCMRDAVTCGLGVTAFYKMLYELDLPTFEINRQCCLAELLFGEEEMIEDLRCLRRYFLRPMQKLGILNEDEHHTLFFGVGRLIPFYKSLVSYLKGLQEPFDDFKQPPQEITNYTVINRVVAKSSSTSQLLVFPSNMVCDVLFIWSPLMRVVLNDYCSNLILARELLDSKQNDARFKKFLSMRKQRGFSRNLDLWSFLDAPRTHMARYSTIIRRILDFGNGLENNVLRHEKSTWESTLRYFDKNVSLINDSIAEARYSFILNRLQIPPELNMFSWTAELPIFRRYDCMIEGSLRDDYGAVIILLPLDEEVLLIRPVMLTSTVKQFCQSQSESSCSSDERAQLLRQCLQSQFADDSSDMIDSVHPSRFRLIRKPIPFFQLVLQDVKRSDDFVFRLFVEREEAAAADVHSISREKYEFEITLHAENSIEKARWLFYFRQCVGDELPEETESRASASASQATKSGLKKKKSTSTGGAGSGRKRQKKSK